ncbi:lengsin-like [Babylonia areolata]|uniref:lengsin-like n=1 Tax=Babylonia areolata TaxID=304850 RepID=UPI003FCF00E1
MSSPAQQTPKNAAASGCGAGQREDEEGWEVDFDYLQCTIPDMHGSPRGRMVPRHLIPRVLKHGFGLFQGIGNFGMNMEVPKGLTEYANTNFANATFLPIPSTARPLQWSSTPDRKLGHVFCTLLFDGKPDPVCPRHTVLRQMEKLEAMGMRFKSSFELEFMMFEGGDVSKPMGGGRKQYGNMELLDDNVDFFMDLLDSLKASGVPVEFFNNEFELGQYEITLEPVEGVAAADAAFLARYGIHAFSRRRGHQATFMARPVYPLVASGFHLNHSVWTTDGRDVFHDPQDPDNLSDFARHWIAGLVHHAPALCAVVCPTVNCYQRFSSGLSPSLNFWNLDDRTCLFRAKAGSSGAYLENRLPSSACNPYLVLAATIAAGLDGVERKLPCPRPGPPTGEAEKEACRVPGSLSEALDALDKDVALKERMGPKVLDYLALLKRDMELKHFENNTTPDMSRAERVEVERKYYMPYL